jgi:hypothetical protein
VNGGARRPTAPRERRICVGQLNGDPHDANCTAGTVRSGGPLSNALELHLSKAAERRRRDASVANAGGGELREWCPLTGCDRVEQAALTGVDLRAATQRWRATGGRVGES